MSIQDIISKRLNTAQISHIQPSFKPGQIVQGRIVKLFLNSKAHIQIGSQSMIAQLEASLTIGENYHFQVKSNTDVMHLKVIGQQLDRNMSDNMQSLLKELGIKSTRSNLSLVQQLTRDKVPFDREQLVKASQLLEGSGNKAQAQSVIKNMIQSKLPLTDSVYQAITAKSTSGFTEQLTGLLQQIKNETNPTQLKQELMNQLATLTNQTNSKKGSLITHILTELEANQTDFFKAAKSSALVDGRVDFSSWKNAWQNLVKQNQERLPTQTVKTSNQLLTSSTLPFQLNHSEVLKVLGEVVENKDAILKQVQTISQQFSTEIRKTSIHQIPLATEDFQELKTQVENKLLPMMPDKQKLHLKMLLQNNPSSLAELQSTFKTLTNEQTYERLEQLVNSTKRSNELLVTKPQEQFLTHITRVLQSTGFGHEYNLAHDRPEQQSVTIKSMIMQLLQQSDGMINDRAQQLLHFINGMQLQSVTDTTNFLQASLLIPGERLSLNKDLQLEFEGRKTESGKIDPAYCRILFYLDLTNLHETVIDMNIQKRAVSITIFNDNPSFFNDSEALKPLLKKGLSELDYHLSNIAIKPLKQADSDNSKDKAVRTNETNSYQGVDYRV